MLLVLNVNLLILFIILANHNEMLDFELPKYLTNVWIKPLFQIIYFNQGIKYSYLIMNNNKSIISIHN